MPTSGTATTMPRKRCGSARGIICGPSTPGRFGDCRGPGGMTSSGPWQCRATGRKGQTDPGQARFLFSRVPAAGPSRSSRAPRRPALWQGTGRGRSAPRVCMTRAWRGSSSQRDAPRGWRLPSGCRRLRQLWISRPLPTSQAPGPEPRRRKGSQGGRKSRLPGCFRACLRGFQSDLQACLPCCHRRPGRYGRHRVPPRGILRRHRVPLLLGLQLGGFGRRRRHRSPGSRRSGPDAGLAARRPSTCCQRGRDRLRGPTSARGPLPPPEESARGAARLGTGGQPRYRSRRSEAPAGDERAGPFQPRLRLGERVPTRRPSRGQGGSRPRSACFATRGQRTSRCCCRRSCGHCRPSSSGLRWSSSWRNGSVGKGGEDSDVLSVPLCLQRHLPAGRTCGHSTS